MHIVFLTGHVPDAPRKTGFYFWSKIFTEKDHNVDWVTLGFSHLTPFGKNKRHYSPPYNCWVQIEDHLRKFSWKPAFHPINTGKEFLNRVTTALFRLYPKLMPRSLQKSLRQADIVIVESGIGLMIVPLLAKVAPQAKIIYTVSDRLETLKFHPVVFDAEKKSIPLFSKIRIPAQIMAEDYPSEAPVEYIPQGIDKSSFDVSYPSPYTEPRNVISVGDMLFDSGSIALLAKSFPDWKFHLFGRNAKLHEKIPNVFTYGEKPFEDLIPYMQHADIGLAPYREEKSAQYLCQSSLKLQQYTYCRLPIVGPHMIDSGQSHIHGYRPGDQDSIITAFHAAQNTRREEIDVSNVLSWSEVLERMINV